MSSEIMTFQSCMPTMLEGKVVRRINSSQNCDTDNYCGLIQLIDKNQSNNATLFSQQETSGSFQLPEGADESGDKVSKSLSRSNDAFRDAGTFYSFRICSLIDRRDVPSLGELVRFQPIDDSILDGKQIPSFADVGCRFKRAGMVVLMKRCLHARVDSIGSKVVSDTFIYCSHQCSIYLNQCLYRSPHSTTSCMTVVV